MSETEAYLGPIIIARYHMVETPIPTKCTNKLCNRDIPGSDARFCAYCGRQFERRNITSPSVLYPPVIPGFNRHDGYMCHRFVVASQKYYHKVDDGIVEILATYNNTSIPNESIQKIANAGYDSVEIVFGLILPESEDD